jgi:hypothetical protein
LAVFAASAQLVVRMQRFPPSQARQALDSWENNAARTLGSFPNQWNNSYL